jgi:hypothetical protein
MERTEILKDTRLFLRDFGRQTFEIYIETVALFAIELFVLSKANRRGPPAAGRAREEKAKRPISSSQVPGLTKAEPEL